MTSSSAVVLSATNNAVLTLTLNRPDRLNAANDELLWSLTEALKQAEQDAAVRVVVITGAGRGFCAGQDLGDVQNRTEATNFTEHLRHTYIPLIQTIRGLKKPVITAVNGVAAGAGASLALAGDIRLWSENATLIEVFSNIALIPDAGSTWMLPRLVGAARAFELMAFAEKVERPGRAEAGPLRAGVRGRNVCRGRAGLRREIGPPPAQCPGSHQAGHQFCAGQQLG